MNYFGLNIKVLREKWGLTQEEFGMLINATRGMIMQYENRGTMPRNATVSRIIKKTGISKDILINTELSEDDLPDMSREDYIFIENFRANPEEYADSGLTDDEVAELATVKKSKIETLTDSLMAEKEARRVAAEERAERAEKEKDRLLSLLERNQNIIDQNLTALMRVTGQIDTNLKGAQGELSAMYVEMQADHGAMMGTLDKIAEQPDGTTAAKAGNVEIETHKQRRQTGKKVGAGKSGMAKE